MHWLEVDQPLHYIKWISQGTYSDSTNYSGAPVVIGQRQGTTSQSWDGFISNVRIVKGTALTHQDSHHQQHH